MNPESLYASLMGKTAGSRAGGQFQAAGEYGMMRAAQCASLGLPANFFIPALKHNQKENPMAEPTRPASKPSGLKSLLIVLAAAWLAWKVWTERDAIFAKIEQASAELQEKLGLSKPST
jgi:hypothetical protein